MCGYHMPVVVFVILGYYLTTSQVSDMCNRYYLGSTKKGIITSPNYPFNYREHQKCFYRFNKNLKDNSSIICFHFHRFELSRTDIKTCFDDYLEFYSTEDQTTIRYCGKGRWNRPDIDTRSHDPRSHVFSSELCWTLADNFVVIFSSNIMLNKKGFYATFEIRDSREHGVNPSVRPLSSDCHFEPENCSIQCLHGYKSDDLGCPYCDCLPEIAQNTAPCKSNEYTCFNRKCITESERCDGVDHCGDGSDESYLHARCTGSQNIKACNFEEDNCNFIGLGWKRSKHSDYRLRHDHTVGNMWGGYFMNADMKGLTAAMLTYTSLPVQARGRHCLSFWYYLGNEGESLSLSITSSLTNKTSEEYDPPPVWYGVVEELGQWRQGEVDIPAEMFPITAVIFEARKQSATNNVAIDDISLLHGECFGDDISCTFEMSWCGWSNDAEIDGEWERLERSAPKNMVSENNMRIPLGFYYISVKERGRLMSRPVSSGNGGDMCLSFMYRMHDVNNLTVIIIQTNTETTVWSRHGSHSPQWKMANIYLNDLRAFQIVLESVTNGEETGNIEVDNLQLKGGYCHQHKITTSNPPITTSSSTISRVSTTSISQSPLTCIDQFTCQDQHRCVHRSNVCDGSFDCDDFSDEKDCPSSRTNVGLSIAIAIIILVAVVVLITVIVVACRRYKRDRGNVSIQRRSSLRDSQETAGPPPSYNLCLVSETVATPPYEAPPRYSF